MSTTTITTEFFCKGNGVMALPTYAIDKLFELFQVSSLPSADLQQPIIDAKVDPAVMTQEYKADVPSLAVVPTLEALWPDIAITRVEEQEKLSIALKTTFNGQWKMQFERSTLEFYNRDGTTLDVQSMAIYSPEKYIDGVKMFDCSEYRNSIVLSVFYDNGAKMEFIKPKTENDINFKVIVREIVTGHKMMNHDKIEEIAIPCFDIDNKTSSLMDCLDAFPSLRDQSGTFMQRILTDQSYRAYLDKLSITTTLRVDEKGTFFQSDLDCEVGIDRCMPVRFVLDSSFFFRVLDANETVLLTGMVKSL